MESETQTRKPRTFTWQNHIVSRLNYYQYRIGGAIGHLRSLLELPVCLDADTYALARRIEQDLEVLRHRVKVAEHDQVVKGQQSRRTSPETRSKRTNHHA